MLAINGWCIMDMDFTGIYLVVQTSGSFLRR